MYKLGVFVLLVSTILTKDVRSHFVTHYTSDKLEEIVAIKTDIQKFLDPLLVPRVSGTDGNVKVQQFIIKTMKELNYEIELDSFEDMTPHGRKPFTNIIATKDTESREKLILAAHFDSKWFADFEFIGATDSSVPCAILLDIATSLNNHFDTRLAFRRNSTVGTLFNGFIDLHTSPTIQFVFFDGEEAFENWSRTDSLYGSRHLAEKWGSMVFTNGESGGQQNLLSQIKALVLLDLIGTPDIRIPNTNKDTTWAWSRLMDIENRLSTQGLLSTQHVKAMRETPDKSGYFYESKWVSQIDDDHRPFQERGVPIVHVIPQPFPSVWHNKNDNADAIAIDSVRDFALIFRVFVAEYFGI